MDEWMSRMMAVIDELTERNDELKMVFEDERAHCEEFRAECQRHREERDEARMLAGMYRDMLQAYGVLFETERLPWEES